MADANNPHFDKIYWYIIMTTILVFGYIVAVTFMDVPKENVRTVDTVSGFLLGTILSAGVGYLLGGNPSASTKKTSIIPENSDTTITATTTSNDTEITTKTNTP